MSKLVVLKFGGKTISDLKNIETAVDRILEAKKDAFPIVVVSAMGDETDKLVELAANIDACGFYREMDQLLATGEMKSAAILSMALLRRGIKAKSLHFANSGIKTNDKYFSGDIIDIDTSMIKQLIKEETIPVIAGYQGINKYNDVTTLGRGGSDITAVKLSAVLKCECILFKDVGAIYNADPKIYKTQKVSKISLQELENLLGDNPKVIHKTSIDIAKKENVKILIADPKNFEIGTVIE